jgi:hypothetical protein
VIIVAAETGPFGVTVNVDAVLIGPEVGPLNVTAVAAVVPPPPPVPPEPLDATFTLQHH